MAMVMLGRMVLRWCDPCRLPVLSQQRCGTCGGVTRPVPMTPPGDVRPAFSGDIRVIRETLERQHGCAPGIDGKRPIILSAVPGPERHDEVILEGRVIGTLRFSPGRGFEFLPRVGYGRMLALHATKNKVVVAEDAVRFVSADANLLVPGLGSVSNALQADDQAIVVAPDGTYLYGGPVKTAMPLAPGVEKGVAVKRRKSSSREFVPAARDQRREGYTPESTWPELGTLIDGAVIEAQSGATGTGDPLSFFSTSTGRALVIDANARRLERLLKRARGFILTTVEDRGLPVAVSFSGGKDSLASLHLVLEAGLRPEVMFIDTGLELPETVEHCHEVADRLGLDMVVGSAGDAFWDAVPFFGPPGRDFRWCCKTSKLGPVSRLIGERYPDGVLSFIGQRRYESFQRSKKAAVWENPWVSGQVGASPIQDWTALDVWLYLFSRGESGNPWYERGMGRIGCFMCPASDLSELQMMREQYDGMGRWDVLLSDHARKRGLPQSWSTLGLWRWKSPPGYMVDVIGTVLDDDERAALLDSLNTFTGGSDVDMAAAGTPDILETVVDGGGVRPGGRVAKNLFMETPGVSPCAEGGSTSELACMFPIDVSRLRTVAVMLGSVSSPHGTLPIPGEPIKGHIVITGGQVEGGIPVRYTVFPDGLVSIRAGDEPGLREATDRLKRVLLSSMFCTGCGICASRCPRGCLQVSDGNDDGAARTLPVPSMDDCTGCLVCLERCPLSFFET